MAGKAIRVCYGMRWKLFEAGRCRHLEVMAVKGGAWRSVSFPALCMGLETPAGWLMVDTGYAPRVLEACRKGWWRLYPRMLPVEVTQEETVAAQLKKTAGEGKPVMGVFLTHFHVDHEGGLRDFPDVPIWASRVAWEASREQSGWAGFRAAHLHSLLPDDFSDRLNLVVPVSNKAPHWVPEGWREGADVLGDGTLWAVDLPGHAVGQIGLMFLENSGRLVFLVADAMWRADWLLPGHGPQWPARFVTQDSRAFSNTLDRLRQLAWNWPDVRIVPFHCAATAQALGLGQWIG